MCPSTKRNPRLDISGLHFASNFRYLNLSHLKAEFKFGNNDWYFWLGLKKVTDDMKTHKNPALRQGPKPFVPSPKASPVAAPKSVAAPVSRPPKFALEAKKWIIVSVSLRWGYYLREPLSISRMPCADYF